MMPQRMGGAGGGGREAPGSGQETKQAALFNQSSPTNTLNLPGSLMLVLSRSARSALREAAHASTEGFFSCRAPDAPAEYANIKLL